jgi:uncharacterized protein (DUF608 family)
VYHKDIYNEQEIDPWCTMYIVNKICTQNRTT